MTTDTWQSGSTYEQYMGRWSRQIAAEFVRWLEVPPRRSWLDVGCGTGALTETILQHADPAAVLGIDPAPAFIEYARERIRDGRAVFRTGDARSLPVENQRFDAVVSGLALNFMPEPAAALAAMARAAEPGGVVAVYVWDYADGMQMLRAFWDAAIDLDPAAAEEDEGPRFPVCRPGPLAGLFEGAGLQGVEVTAIDTTARYRDFDDFWQPFLGGQGPAPGYVARLSEEHRMALREQVRSKLTIAAGGSITLLARAWGARGRT